MPHYREFPPSAALQPFVESTWTLEHDGASLASQRVVPDGHSELILNLGQPFEAFQAGQWDRQPRTFFAGQIDGPLLLRPQGPAKILGVRFRPHGAAALLRPPMHELAGRFTSLADLSPRLSRDLDCALESPAPAAAVEAALLLAANAAPAPGALVCEAVHRIVQARGAVDLARLARGLGVSTRQLERRFNAAVGLPPKLFCRMQRFTHVFRVIGNEPSQWADVAAACGYYDQAHLIRDFKNFSGETPAVLLSRDADLARHFLRRFGVSHSYNTAPGASL